MMLKNPRFVTFLSLGLLMTGLVVDLTTSSELVVAIIYNIPIALSSLALSRRLTISVLLLAFVANIAAGYVNSLIANGLDLDTLLNRSLAAFSFLLVGLLTLFLRDASSQVESLKLQEQRSERNEALRRSLNALSHSLYPEPLLQAAATQIQSLLDANEVVITGVAKGSFAKPRYVSPPNTMLAKNGEVAQWATDVLPLKTPVSVLRQDDGLRAVARLERAHAPELFIIARGPRVDAPKLRLGEIVAGLEPLLARADELERLKAN